MCNQTYILRSIHTSAVSTLCFLFSTNSGWLQIFFNIVMTLKCEIVFKPNSCTRFSQYETVSSYKLI